MKNKLRLKYKLITNKNICVIKYISKIYKTDINLHYKLRKYYFRFNIDNILYIYFFKYFNILINRTLIYFR